MCVYSLEQDRSRASCAAIRPVAPRPAPVRDRSLRGHVCVCAATGLDGWEEKGIMLDCGYTWLLYSFEV